MFVAVAVLLAQVPVSSPATLPFVSLDAVRVSGGFTLMSNQASATALFTLGDDGVGGGISTLSGFPGALYESPPGVMVVTSNATTVIRYRIAGGVVQAANTLFSFDAGSRDGGLPILGGVREAAGGRTPSGVDVAAWSTDQTFNNPDIFLNGALVGVGDGLRFCGATPLLLSQRLLPNPMLQLPDLVVARTLDGGQLGSESGLLVSCTGALATTWAVVRGTEGPLGEDGGPPVLWSPELALVRELESDRVVDVDFDGVSLWALIHEDAGVSVRRFSSSSASPLDATPVPVLTFPVNEPRLTLSGPGRGLLTYATVAGGGAYVFVGGKRAGEICAGSNECFVGACVAGRCTLVLGPDAGPGDAGAPDGGPGDGGVDAGVRIDGGIGPGLDAGLSDAGGPDSGTPDAGPDGGTPGRDAGSSDAGSPDAGTGTPDAGTPDAGTPDAGTPDAGTPDASISDAGTPDASTSDAGTPDGSILDAGVLDAGTPDAGAEDAGPQPPIDAGQVDAGASDAGAGRPDAGPGERRELQVGCGCTSGGTMAALFSLGALLVRRRRR